MTREEYLKKLDDITASMTDICERITSISIADSISMLRLQFDIYTAIYNTTKEN